ncbi:MAG: inositol monophosphatase [Chloroflexi bacterium]|nr:inositol monophosphatase [Chloroflexota bacterium]
MPDLPLAQNKQSALEVATQAAKDAGKIILAHFLKEKQVTSKGRGNIVTDVDLKVERTLVDLIQREYPQHSILSEESPQIAKNSNYTWIIDPVDGTRNFASGVPFFAVSIALAHGSDILLGVTYDPIRDELFWAQKGMGAYRNEYPIAVSSKENVRSSVIGLDMGYDDERARQGLKLLLELWPGMQSMRVMGSAALGLAYAACGRLDLYFHHNLAPWDLASGLLLVKEAKGIITDRRGGPISFDSDGAIASSATIHADFLRLVSGHPWQTT